MQPLIICVVTSATQPNLEGAAVTACKYLELSKTQMVIQRSDALGDMDPTPEKASIILFSRDCFCWHFVLSCLSFIEGWFPTSVYICHTFPSHSVSHLGGSASFAKPVFSKSTGCRWVMKTMGELPPTTPLFLLRTQIQMCLIRLWLDINNQRPPNETVLCASMRLFLIFHSS